MKSTDGWETGTILVKCKWNYSKMNEWSRNREPDIAPWRLQRSVTRAWSWRKGWLQQMSETFYWCVDNSLRNWFTDAASYSERKLYVQIVDHDEVLRQSLPSLDLCPIHQPWLPSSRHNCLTAFGVIFIISKIIHQKWSTIQLFLMEYLHQVLHVADVSQHAYIRTQHLLG